MGSIPVRCYIGFSTENISPLTAELETHGARMERHYIDSQNNLFNGLSVLHDAIDAALDGDQETVEKYVDRSLEHLDACNHSLSAIGESLAHSRRRLAETGGEEPLVAREHFFPSLDYDSIYNNLLEKGGALPGRVYWDDVVTAVRESGASGGLRVLEKTLRRVQTEVRTYAAEVVRVRERPLGELARELHGMTTGVAAILTQTNRFLTEATYLNVVCEQATFAHERGERVARGA